MAAYGEIPMAAVTPLLRPWRSSDDAAALALHATGHERGQSGGTTIALLPSLYGAAPAALTGESSRAVHARDFSA